MLVLEPGTSAGSAYFVPLAKWIVSKTTGWQVWSVERRENLLEDQSELNLFKHGKATSTQLYNYYLGYLKDPSITKHFQIDPELDRSRSPKQWGMNVAVEDLHRVIAAAKTARRQGRARWPLARRIGRHRVRHLGLRRPRRAPTTSRAWSTSTAAAARAR